MRTLTGYTIATAPDTHHRPLAHSRTACGDPFPNRAYLNAEPYPVSGSETTASLVPKKTLRRGVADGAPNPAYCAERSG